MHRHFVTLSSSSVPLKLSSPLSVLPEYRDQGRNESKTRKANNQTNKLLPKRIRWACVRQVGTVYLVLFAALSGCGLHLLARTSMTVSAAAQSEARAKSLTMGEEEDVDDCAKAEVSLPQNSSFRAVALVGAPRCGALSVSQSVLASVATCLAQRSTVAL